MPASGLLYLPAGSVGDAHIDATDPLSTNKVTHQHAATYAQASGAVVADATQLFYIARATGTIAAMKVAIDTAPTGGDKAYTVDLKKSTGGGAFASILSAVVTVNSSSTSLSVVAGTLSTATYAASDIFEIVVDASGSTGTQGYGVCVLVEFEEGTT